MLHSTKNIDNWESSNELISLPYQVKASRLQDKLRKQNVHEDMKKVFGPSTKTIQDASGDVAKAIT